MMSVILITSIIISCNSSSCSLQYAGSNNKVMKNIIELYADSMSIKRKSAEFLVDNMIGHFYYKSPAITSFRNIAVR